MIGQDQICQKNLGLAFLQCKDWSRQMGCRGLNLRLSRLSRMHLKKPASNFLAVLKRVPAFAGKSRNSFVKEYHRIEGPLKIASFCNIYLCDQLNQSIKRIISSIFQSLLAHFQFYPYTNGSLTKLYLQSVVPKLVCSKIDGKRLVHVDFQRCLSI